MQVCDCEKVGGVTIVAVVMVAIDIVDAMLTVVVTVTVVVVTVVAIAFVVIQRIRRSSLAPPQSIHLVVVSAVVVVIIRSSPCRHRNCHNQHSHLSRFEKHFC